MFKDSLPERSPKDKAKSLWESTIKRIKEENRQQEANWGKLEAQQYMEENKWGEELGREQMEHTEEFLIVALERLFNIKHFMSDQGNHIFIDNDPGYQMTRQIWRFTQEELKAKLLEMQSSLSQP